MGSSQGFRSERDLLICDLEDYPGSVEEGAELGGGGWRQGS